MYKLYYFLLNNDTVLPEDTIQKLYDYHSQFSNIGALVPKLLNQDKAGKIDASYSIFALLCIELWARIFIDNFTVKK